MKDEISPSQFKHTHQTVPWRRGRWEKQEARRGCLGRLAVSFPLPPGKGLYSGQYPEVWL